jgi:hypothetical protein
MKNKLLLLLLLGCMYAQPSIPKFEFRGGLSLNPAASLEHDRDMIDRQNIGSDADVHRQYIPLSLELRVPIAKAFGLSAKWSHYSTTIKENNADLSGSDFKEFDIFYDNIEYSGGLFFRFLDEKSYSVNGIFRGIYGVSRRWIDYTRNGEKLKQPTANTADYGIEGGVDFGAKFNKNIGLGAEVLYKSMPYRDFEYEGITEDTFIADFEGVQFNVYFAIYL